MRLTPFAMALLALALTACSDSEHETNKSRPISDIPSTPAPVMQSKDEAEKATAPAPAQPAAPAVTAPTEAAQDMAAKAPATAGEVTGAEDKAEMAAPEKQEGEAAAPAVAPSVSVLSHDDALALAKKSGCFACHALDKRLVGPAWQDVAARYASDKAAGKQHLLVKVAKGGQGVWADAGINVAMPPYSPRVSDESIEQLVDFVLSLAPGAAEPAKTSMMDAAKDAVEDVAAGATSLLDSVNAASEESADTASLVDAIKVAGEDTSDASQDMAPDSSASAGALMGAAEEATTSAAQPATAAAVSMDEGTALAKKSGCFACHALDKRLVGPAWQDVAARYAADKAAGKQHLLVKVAKGGQGVWADAGINIAMPPYSPRVSDADIETLVDFILAL